MDLRDNSAPQGDYISSGEAIKLLDVKPQTLYAYVSRGWIRSVADGGKKVRLYSREDVERVRARSNAKSGKRALAGSGLRWGEPLVYTTITEITPEGPKYRGRLALELARSQCSFEAVAELLWSGAWFDEHVTWPLDPPRADIDRLVEALGVSPRQGILEIFSALTLAIGSAEGGDHEIKQSTTILAARRLIKALAGCFGYLSKEHTYSTPAKSDSVAAATVRALGIPAADDAVVALNAALILLADHEMTPSTFCSRVTASCGADLFSCVLSTMCAHSGTRMRRACDKAEELLGGSTSEADFRHKLAAFKKSATVLPGFNHPLYPNGDPRAAYLIDLAKNQLRQAAGSEKIYRLLDEAASEFQAYPSVETGLVTLCYALNLPAKSAGGVFVLGRAVGWIAHILEQRLAGSMLRPRARYVSL